MAGVKTTLGINDQMSPKLKAIAAALASCETGFSIVKKVSQTSPSTKAIEKATRSTSGLVTQLKYAAATYLSFRTIGAVVSWSDEMTNTNARINMINDGLQKSSELQKMIYDSAQRSGSAYGVQADVVAKIGLRAGKIFTNNKETIRFAETLSKMFGIAGASTEEQQSASLQLVQALGSGVLRGEEFNAVFEAAPNIMQAVAKSMGMPIEQLRNLASQGKISAGVVKKAMLEASVETDAQFKKIPLTWSRISTMALNAIQRAAWPLQKKISDIFNSKKFQSFLNSAVVAAQYFIGFVSWGFDKIAIAVNFAQNNMKKILPILGAVGFGIIAVKTAIMVAYIPTIFKAIAATLQLAFVNMIAWNAVTLAIVAVVGLAASLTILFNKLTGASFSFFGMVAGLAAEFLALCYDIFAKAANYVFDFLDFIGDGVGDLAADVFNALNYAFTGFIPAVRSMFGNLIGGMMLLLQPFLMIFDKVMKTNYSDKMFGITQKVRDFISGPKFVAPEKFNFDESRGTYGKKKFDILDPGDAFEAGYNWGDTIEERIKNKLTSLLGGLEAPGMFDFSKVGGGGDGTNDLLKNIADNTAETAKNTNEKSYQYLRDAMENRVLNRISSQNIKLVSNNKNSISSNMDIDNVVSRMTSGLKKAMSSSAEGVTA